MDMIWENKKMLKFLIGIIAHKAVHEKEFQVEDDERHLGPGGLLLCGHDQDGMNAMRAISARGEQGTKTVPWQTESCGVLG